MSMTQRATIGLAAVFSTSVLSANAQQFPTKPLRLIVPLAPRARISSPRKAFALGDGDGARTPGWWRHRLIQVASALLGGVLALTLTAHAQQYPTKPLRLIVPLAPGGPSDILARTMAQQMTGGLKQSVVVDNRTGAGGTIGIDMAAKSPADGYTMLLVASATYTINANIYTKLPYDPRKDLLPVSILAGAPYILVTHPSLPVRSAKELIALAKARPGQLNYGSGGTGTGPQFAFELFKLRAGIDIVHIPYKGTGPALTETMAGQVQVGLFNMIAALPVAQSGRLRALAVSGDKRSARLPDVPTMAEQGVTGFEEIGGHMIMVPAATPREIVTRLHQEMMKALNTPEVKARLESEGAEIIASTPEQAAATVKADLERWGEVVKRTGFRADSM